MKHRQLNDKLRATQMVEIPLFIAYSYSKMNQNGEIKYNKGPAKVLKLSNKIELQSCNFKLLVRQLKTRY